MSPRKQLRSSSDAVDTAVNRIWIAFGIQVRDARIARRWSVAELARRAGLSSGFVYMVEAGRSGSIEAAARIASAFGWRTQLDLSDPRRRDRPRAELSVDPVHSAMGEFEARHLRLFGLAVGIDEPYQHFQFAGRADVAAWDLEKSALLHIENRTRFPDFQDMAGSYNAKRAYLAESIGARVGVRRWASETHVMAALWSAEVLHTLRLRQESFRSICRDGSSAFEAWWRGEPPRSGVTSSLIVLDPRSTGSQRSFVALDDALTARPRYRGYADAAAQLRGEITG